METGSLLDLTIPAAANEEKSDAQKKKATSAALLPQVIATLVMNFSSLASGLSTGFPAVSLPQIRDDPDILATVDEGSWIASLAALGSICGCLLSVFVSDRLGRRKVMMIGALPQLIGCVTIGTAPNVQTIFAGRYLFGFGSGFQTTNRMVYIAEVTEARLRGTATATNMLFWTIGMLIVYVMGTVLDWRNVALISSAVPALSIICLFFLADSPAWMASKGKAKEAEAALRWYRGRRYNIEEEMTSLMKKADEANQRRKPTVREHMTELTSQSSMRPLCIITLLFTVAHFSGITSIFTYAVDIFQQLNSDVDKYTASLTVGGVQVVVNMVTVFLIHKLPRRVLLLISTIGVSLTSITLGTYTYIDARHIANGEEGLPARWLPAALVWLHLVFTIPGLFSVPLVLIGELFPLRNRGLLGCVAGVLNYILYFMSVKTFPALLETIMSYGVFWLYGCVTFVGAVFVYFILPETRNKTLDEIEKAMLTDSVLVKKYHHHMRHKPVPCECN